MYKGNMAGVIVAAMPSNKENNKTEYLENIGRTFSIQYVDMTKDFDEIQKRLKDIANEFVKQ